MTDLSPEEQRRIRDTAWALARRIACEHYGVQPPIAIIPDEIPRPVQFAIDVLTEQALSHAREKEEMKAEGADYTRTTEKAFASLSAERDELKRRVEELEANLALSEQTIESGNRFSNDLTDRISSLEAALEEAGKFLEQAEAYYRQGLDTLAIVETTSARKAISRLTGAAQSKPNYGPDYLHGCPPGTSE